MAIYQAFLYITVPSLDVKCDAVVSPANSFGFMDGGIDLIYSHRFGTNLGYALFRCKNCHRTFNERTSTPFNFIEVPTDIVFQVLLCRFRYKLSFRDIAEFFLLRGFEFTHETVRDWEKRFAAIFAQQLRAKRQGKVGRIWFVDEVHPC